MQIPRIMGVERGMFYFFEYTPRCVVIVQRFKTKTT